MPEEHDHQQEPMHDVVYDAVSVLYHELQTCSSAEKYIADAKDADDPDLVGFFENLKQGALTRAQEARDIVEKVITNDDWTGRKQNLTRP